MNPLLQGISDKKLQSHNTLTRLPYSAPEVTYFLICDVVHGPAGAFSTDNPFQTS